MARGRQKLVFYTVHLKGTSENHPLALRRTQCELIPVEFQRSC